MVALIAKKCRNILVFIFNGCIVTCKLQLSIKRSHLVFGFVLDDESDKEAVLEFSHFLHFPQETFIHSVGLKNHVKKSESNSESILPKIKINIRIITYPFCHVYGNLRTS